MATSLSLRRLGSAIRITAITLAATTAGCPNGCTDFNASVSVPPDAGPSIAQSVQSETSMVRLDLANGTSRLVVGYNDAANTTVANGTGFDFVGADSLMGWAYSDDGGQTWSRQDQPPPPQGVAAIRGDPWLAAVGSTALYVALGQPDTAGSTSPNSVVLARWRADQAPTFEPAIVVAGPGADSLDGPKVAASRDGSIALVAWADTTTLSPHYQIVSGITGNALALGGAGIIDPLANLASTPYPTCGNESGPVQGHPMVAIGGATTPVLYLAIAVEYDCPQIGSTPRLEVYRSTDQGTSWQRIVSLVNRQHIGVNWMTWDQLNAAPLLNSGMAAPVSNARAGLEVQGLAVSGDGAGHDVVLLLALELPAALPGEKSREKAIQYRLTNADTCIPVETDIVNCDMEDVAGAGRLELDQSFKNKWGVPVMSRLGVWEYQPAIFSSGKGDGQVGVVWYAQPYAGTMAPVGDQPARTIVEAVFSMDAGASYSIPFEVTANSPNQDPVIGDYFEPCPDASSFYFGDYISGAFVSAWSPTRVAWADSRAGCVQESSLADTYHQHVFAGGRIP